MKKIKLFLIAAVLIGCTAVNLAQTIPSYVPSSGLVGWWPFNGNANDESGNNNNGTVNGATLTSDRFGNTGKAYFFNGFSNYITAGTSNFPSGNQQRTISIWFKTNNYPVPDNTYTLLNYGQAGNNNSCGLAIDSILGGGPRLYFFSWNNSDVLNTNIFNLGIWHNLLGSFDGAVGKLYLDGQLIGQNANQWNTIVTLFTIGKNNQTNNSPPYFFYGELDDLGIWNRALTQQEITSLYNGACSLQASIVSSGTATICQGSNVVLSSVNKKNNYTYQWLKNNASISNSTSFSLSASTSGNYSLLIDSAGCKDTSNVIAVKVNPLPNVSANSLPAFINVMALPVALSGTPTGGTFTGKGVSSNTFTPSVANLGSHTLTYNYTDANNCSSTSSVSTIVYDTLGGICLSYDTTYVTVTDTLYITRTITGINISSQLSTIKVYPNPAKEKLFIDIDNFSALNGYSITVLNSLSQTVYSTVVNSVSKNLNISAWSTGLYILYLKDNKGKIVENKKILVN